MYTVSQNKVTVRFIVKIFAPYFPNAATIRCHVQLAYSELPTKSGSTDSLDWQFS